jgi:hypothetical protein
MTSYTYQKFPTATVYYDKTKPYARFLANRELNRSSKRASQLAAKAMMLYKPGGKKR